MILITLNSTSHVFPKSSKRMLGRECHCKKRISHVELSYFIWYRLNKMLDFHIFIHGHRLWIRGNGGTLQICVKCGKINQKSYRTLSFKIQINKKMLYFYISFLENEWKKSAPYPLLVIKCLSIIIYFQIEMIYRNKQMVAFRFDTPFQRKTVFESINILSQMAQMTTVFLGMVFLGVLFPNMINCWTREGRCYSALECDNKMCFNYCKLYGYRSSSCDRHDILCPNPARHFKCRCTDQDILVK